MEDIEKLIEQYKLSKNEHNKVLKILKENLFADRKQVEKSSILFIIGQPGCGKTTYIKNTDLSNYVIINSDDYRKFNKYSKEILEKYPTDYARLTNYDAHLWGDELFLYAIQNGYSVLREKAPTDNSLLEQIKEILPYFEVAIHVVVRGNLESILATRERYEKEILEKKNAKLSNMEAHNKCYNLLPSFITKCLSLDIVVNYVVVTENQYKTITVKDDDLNLLESLRNESNKQACLNYEKKINNIKEAMRKRNAPLEQFEELKKIDDIYFKVKNYK